MQLFRTAAVNPTGVKDSSVPEQRASPSTTYVIGGWRGEVGGGIGWQQRTSRSTAQVLGSKRARKGCSKPA
eukprot:scaffold16736_cov84-Isochrysis_galbana.AAC.1